MLLTLISTYMQNIIWILFVHNLFLAANVCKYTVRYAVRLPDSKLNKGDIFLTESYELNLHVVSSDVHVHYIHL